MHLRSDSFTPFARIDSRFAFARHHDTDDVPSVGDDVNQEGKTVPIDLPRTPFFHWVVVDLPPSLRTIAEGTHSDGVLLGWIGISKAS